MIRFNNEEQYGQLSTSFKPQNESLSNDMIPVKDLNTRRMTEKHKKNFKLEELKVDVQEK